MTLKFVARRGPLVPLPDIQVIFSGPQSDSSKVDTILVVRFGSTVGSTISGEVTATVRTRCARGRARHLEQCLPPTRVRAIGRGVPPSFLMSGDVA